MLDRKGGCAHRIRGASPYNKLLLPVFGKMSVGQEQSPYRDRITSWKSRLRTQSVLELRFKTPRSNILTIWELWRWGVLSRFEDNGQGWRWRSKDKDDTEKEMTRSGFMLSVASWLAWRQRPEWTWNPDLILKVLAQNHFLAMHGILARKCLLAENHPKIFMESWPV